MKISKKASIGMSIGALGIVFGDIGTSPLYVFSSAFSKSGFKLTISKEYVLGILSLIIWSLIVVVSIKFIVFLMRADNDGDGGILSLVTILRNHIDKIKHKKIIIIMGIIGVALFFGDSTITPAISVLSAVEGLRVITPELSNLIIPITLLVVSVLFLIQSRGSGYIGKYFGPIMLIWFSSIGLAGLFKLIAHPLVLAGLSPITGMRFVSDHPLTAFIAMGAVVLAITGAEALYADLGHFGRTTIQNAWFYVVFPALILCYLGEAASILNNASAATNPLFSLFPTYLEIPAVVLATVSTVIASQSVISGTFSLVKQAVALNFLPKMNISHTSIKKIGQIYIPGINLLLFLSVSFLIIYFKSSDRLAAAYGIAVSGTLLIDALLYLIVTQKVWLFNNLKLFFIGLIILPLDIVFVLANSVKFISGGWFPIAIGIVVFVIILTWMKGQEIISKERRLQEKPLAEFIKELAESSPPIKKIPGLAIYIGHHQDLTPLALRANLSEFHELHQEILIINIEITNKPHVPEDSRGNFTNLDKENKINHLVLSYGFRDHINIPETLSKLPNLSPHLKRELPSASYFISLSEIVMTTKKNLASWRKIIYVFLSKNAVTSSEFYKLPLAKTVEIRYLLSL